MSIYSVEKEKNIMNFLAKARGRVKQVLIESVTMRKVTMPYELRRAEKVDAALECIRQRWPEAFDTVNDNDDPVFILSAGWRSGSTLLQRLVISSGEVAVWGEPLGDAAIIQRLAISLASLSSNWPSDTYFERDRSLLSLSNKWTANITPPISCLRESHRALLKQWLAYPAKEMYGVSRWGLKEVRLTINHARYLKWLFPNARFLFIYRNLFHAYRSWKGNVWGCSWPGYFSWSPVAFARHWRLLVEGFLNGYKDVDGLLVKFEDLIAGNFDLCKIADHIGAKSLDPSVLSKKIAGIPRDRKKGKLNIFDRIILSVIGGRVLKKLGYR